MVIPREPRFNRGLRRDYTPTPQTSKAYLLGILHDASIRKTTYRIATKNLSFCKFLVKEIKKLGVSAWFYKEGKNRNLWIVEFSKKLLKGVKIKSKQDKIDYIRGYFDSEGGIAKSKKVRFYLYFAQKNKEDLSEVKNYLTDLNIFCGRLHNPSKRVDPNYWRFFIRAKSYKDFKEIIGSLHPEKSKILRMKI
jgi:hypothetical protein